MHGGQKRRDGGRGLNGLPFLGAREALDGGKVAPTRLAEHPGAGRATAKGTDTHAGVA